ncbi:ABC transporter ATP-binding protein [Streptomyces sp. NPDC021356]|uniref:ABC transporter ATP-binding protein n=1 Tax=Streptomyces sp. NPDC021356 TaxID=3154900 RepID=UPI0033F5BD6D
MSTVLELRDLRVEFGDGVTPVRGVDLSLRRGEVLGLVGESGAGKTLTALAALGLLPRGARARGSVRLLGTELVGLRVRDLARLRGSRIAMVFQDPLAAFTPVHRIGDQIGEVLRIHERPRPARRSARQRAVELLTELRVPDPERVARAYPHELSGGLRQRAMIAMAVAGRPDVIVADEPTSSLDVSVQAEILAALEEARAATGAALLLVSHDLGVVAGAADRVAVMYAGRVVETAPTDLLFAGPRMPYTMGLLAAAPRLDAAHALIQIPGAPPAPGERPEGCAFAPRCPVAGPECERTAPVLRAHPVAAREGTRASTARPQPPAPTGPPTASGPPAAGGHQVACLRPEVTATRTAADLYPASPRPEPRSSPHSPVPALRVTALQAAYGDHRAVLHADLEIRRGETVALVGESGAGKSTTLSRIIALTAPAGGRVEVLGQDTALLTRSAQRSLRGRVQIVLQDPSASLDPRMTVARIVAEPMEARRTPPEHITARVRELLAQVELDPRAAGRRPHQLSGGQRQRVALARALAVRPELLLLDEPVSALDVSVQAGIIALLRRLTSAPGSPACLLVSHDLAVVRQLADRVVVMHGGRTVESGTVDAVLGRPRHPYTRALLSAVPVPRPDARRPRPVPPPVAPEDVDTSAGCAFRGRCPVYRRLAAEHRLLCERDLPAPAAPAGAACHFPHPDEGAPLRGRPASKGRPPAAQ